MTTPTTDPLRAFTTALTWRARHLLAIDTTTVAALRRAADQGVDLAQLAAVVSKGIGKYNDANAAGLMRYRLARELRKALGENDDEETAG